MAVVKILLLTRRARESRLLLRGLRMRGQLLLDLLDALNEQLDLGFLRLIGRKRRRVLKFIGIGMR